VKFSISNDPLILEFKVGYHFKIDRCGEKFALFVLKMHGKSLKLRLVRIPYKVSFVIIFISRKLRFNATGALKHN